MEICGIIKCSFCVKIHDWTHSCAPISAPTLSESRSQKSLVSLYISSLCNFLTSFLFLYHPLLPHTLFSISFQSILLPLPTSPSPSLSASPRLPPFHPFSLTFTLSLSTSLALSASRGSLSYPPRSVGTIAEWQICIFLSLLAACVWHCAEWMSTAPPGHSPLCLHS